MIATNHLHALSVFTPSNSTPEDLEFILVQRHDLLQDAVERVRESALTDHKHHLLFVGPRGCGKTHLITLIVHRAGLDNDLADPLRIAWLNEDETCTTLLEFLLKVHAALEKRYPGEYRSESLSPAFEMKPAAALEFISRQVLASLGPRTLMVAAENLDAIFENLGPAGQKQLRAFIQENPRLTFVATAQKLVESLSNRNSPFYGFFQTEHLKPLNVDDATELLKNIGRLRGNQEIVDFLSTSRGRSRVQALHHLSGGNHRIYIVLSQFITRDSVDALVGPFMKMVDELTPYYQERVRWLPAQQRKIVEYLCACETTVPVKDIAKRLFATPQTISSQLQDLREKGYVESNQRGRESLYEISEPLMRLCVEVKENQRHQPLRLIVDFLRVWYDNHQLCSRLELLDPTASSRAYLVSAIERNKAEGNLRKILLIEDLRLALPDKFNQINCDDLIDACKALPEFVSLAIKCYLEKRMVEAVEIIDEGISESADDELKFSWIYLRASFNYAAAEYGRAIDDCSAIINNEGCPEGLIAKAYLSRGLSNERVGEIEKAFEDYTSVIKFNRSFFDNVSLAYIKRGDLYYDANDACKAIMDYTSVIESKESPQEYIKKAYLCRSMAYGKIEEFEKALRDASEAVALFDNSDGEKIGALFVRGVIHETIENDPGAILDYSSAIELSQDFSDIAIMALKARADAFARMGDPAAAVKDYKAVIVASKDAGQFVEASIALAEVQWSEGAWDEGFVILSKALEHGAIEGPPFLGLATALVDTLFSTGVSPQLRQKRVCQLFTLYHSNIALPVLSDGLVKSLGGLFRGQDLYPAPDNLEHWATSWEQAAEGVDEFRLPLRLLRTGIDFLIAGGKDEGILLRLTSAEREILKQAFGLTEKN